MFSQQTIVSENEKYQFWQKYNDSNSSGTIIVSLTLNGVMTLSPSLSFVFFKQFNLFPHLNANHQRALQLGASTGDFLASFAAMGWNVKGYDYSSNSIQAMQSKQIPCSLIDLNHFNPADLSQDLQATTNIFAIRILEYLDNQARSELIFTLMNLAIPGSTFFFVHKTNGQHHLKHGYLATFFSARRDMTILLHDRTPKALNPDVMHERDSVLVVRKR